MGACSSQQQLSDLLPNAQECPNCRLVFCSCPTPAPNKQPDTTKPLQQSHSTTNEMISTGPDPTDTGGTRAEPGESSTEDGAMPELDEEEDEMDNIPPGAPSTTAPPTGETTGASSAITVPSHSPERRAPVVFDIPMDGRALAKKHPIARHSTGETHQARHLKEQSRSSGSARDVSDATVEAAKTRHTDLTDSEETRSSPQRAVGQHQTENAHPRRTVGHEERDNTRSSAEDAFEERPEESADTFSHEDRPIGGAVMARRKPASYATNTWNHPRASQRRASLPSMGSKWHGADAEEMAKIRSDAAIQEALKKAPRKMDAQFYRDFAGSSASAVLNDPESANADRSVRSNVKQQQPQQQQQPLPRSRSEQTLSGSMESPQRLSVPSQRNGQGTSPVSGQTNQEHSPMSQGNGNGNATRGKGMAARSLSSNFDSQQRLSTPQRNGNGYVARPQSTHASPARQQHQQHHTFTPPHNLSRTQSLSNVASPIQGKIVGRIAITPDGQAVLVSEPVNSHVMQAGRQNHPAYRGHAATVGRRPQRRRSMTDLNLFSAPSDNMFSPESYAQSPMYMPPQPQFVQTTQWKAGAGRGVIAATAPAPNAVYEPYAGGQAQNAMLYVDRPRGVASPPTQPQSNTPQRGRRRVEEEEEEQKPAPTRPPPGGRSSTHFGDDRPIM